MNESFVKVASQFLASRRKSALDFSDVVSSPGKSIGGGALLGALGGLGHYALSSGGSRNLLHSLLGGTAVGALGGGAVYGVPKLLDVAGGALDNASDLAAAERAKIDMPKSIEERVDDALNSAGETWDRHKATVYGAGAAGVAGGWHGLTRPSGHDAMNIQLNANRVARAQALLDSREAALNNTTATGRSLQRLEKQRDSAVNKLIKRQNAHSKVVGDVQTRAGGRMKGYGGAAMAALVARNVVGDTLDEHVGTGVGTAARRAMDVATVTAMARRTNSGNLLKRMSKSRLGGIIGGTLAAGEAYDWLRGRSSIGDAVANYDFNEAGNDIRDQWRNSTNYLGDAIYEARGGAQP